MISKVLEINQVTRGARSGTGHFNSDECDNL